MKNYSFCKKRVIDSLLFLICLVAIATVAGCAKNNVPLVAEEQKDYFFNDLTSAAQHLSGVIVQELSASNSDKDSLVVVVDVFFNEQSAEVSADGRNIQKLLIDSLLEGTPKYLSEPLGTKSLQKAHLVITGIYSLQPQATTLSENKWIKIKTIVQDINTGNIIAQPEAFVDFRSFDAEPTRLYRDAPMYTTTAQFQKQVVDPSEPSLSLAETLLIKATLADARSAYESGDFSHAEKLFGEVLTLTNNKSFLALSGIYQSQINTDRLDEAEKTFGKLVGAGLDAGSLSIKFLFKVGRTDFMEIGNLATQYPIWIRQIALQLYNKNQCLSVNGHASLTGRAELNNRLSLHRAEKIVAMLRKAEPIPAGNLRAFGKGFSENIVGSGTNDALDAIDRRVNFEIMQCI